MAQHRRGAITLVFDDGYTTVYQNVVPLLTQYNMPAVFAVALEHAAVERSENRPVTPWPAWLELQRQGHEIAAHSVSHRDLTHLSAAELADELRQPAHQLGAHTLVYPGGAYNRAVASEAARYYRAARSVKKGFENKQPAKPMELKTYNFTRHNFSPRRANARAFWAYFTDRWLIETYHLVDDNETEKKHAVRLTDFAAHLRFLAKVPLEVVTIQQMIDRTQGILSLDQGRDSQEKKKL